jgi:hypothetical protein
MRKWIMLFAAAGCSTAVMAQVRQGGVYQILGESFDPGGGFSQGGSYTLQHSISSLGSFTSGGSFTHLSGFAGSWDAGSSGNGAGAAAFLAWQNVLFGGPSESGAGAMDDPDADDVPNLLEFVFNLPPLVSSTAFAEAGATGGLPWIREELLEEGRYVTMEYIRRKNAGQFLPEVSTSLTGWEPAVSMLLSGPTTVSGPYERVKLRLGPPVQPGGKLFYRLRVLVQ